MWALALPTDSKTPTRMGIEPTTFWFDQRCSTDWATRPTFVLNVTLHCTCTYSLTCNWHLHFPRPAPVWSCSSVGGAVVITKVVGSIRILVGVSLCPCVVPIPSVGLALTLSMGRKLALLVHIHWRAIDIFISHDLLPSDLVAQSVEQWWSRRSWVQFASWSGFPSVLVWFRFRR